MSDCVTFFHCWIEPSLCFCEHSGGISACESSRNLLHVSSFVVCGSSVKQVSHSWHIVLDTCALYTFLNFIFLFISVLNLYPWSELIIIDTVNEKGQTLLCAVVIVTPGTIVSIQTRCVCVVIAHVFGWCELCVDCFPLCGSKCWYCGSYGSMEQKGRILGDTANLESASKEDITATLRHHESLLKSMNAGAPVTARDAIANRIEILKQAIYAKEPFLVQLVKVHAALARAEEVPEKKHSAVWTAKEAADKADQQVLNLRQRMAELTERIYTATDTGMNEDPWSCGEWQDAGGSWSGWQWDQPDGDVQARAGGERTALGIEVENLRGAVLRLQQGQVDVQAGNGGFDWRALRHGWRRLRVLQQAAVPVTPVARGQCKQSPGPMSNQLKLVTPRGTPSKVRSILLQSGNRSRTARTS